MEVSGAVRLIYRSLGVKRVTKTNISLTIADISSMSRIKATAVMQVSSLLQTGYLETFIQELTFYTAMSVGFKIQLIPVLQL